MLFVLAGLAVLEVWVSFRWWRILAGGGAIVLLAGFFGSTKVLPMALDIVVLWAAIVDWLPTTG